ncbi:MAG TPA: hypothetical protein VF085_12055 [Solirubrobacterales bacterium]
MPWQDEDDDGRIPFRIRIGVTGHRTLNEGPLLTTAVRGQIRRIVEFFPDRDTPISLSVVSQLADGADRLVVRQAIAEARERGEEARLEFFLPMGRQDYIDAQNFGAESLAEFDDLMERATVRREEYGISSETSAARGSAYAAGGRRLVARCDVLIALWDGRESGGRGGTAETLLYAAARSKPCVWISTDGEPVVRDNFGADRGKDFYEDVAARAALPSPIRWSPMDHPKKAVQPLLGAFDSLDELNRQSLGVDYDAQLREELVSSRGVAPWVAAPFVRATTLAKRWRWRFQWTARLITLFATAAAVMLAIGLSFGKESEGWAWAEAAFFSGALLSLVVVRRVGFHRRWLTYRVLAEHLRSASFLAPTGADFRRQAKLEAVYTGHEPTGWLMRAFEEVWDRRPLRPPPLSALDEGELAQFKAWLAENWIGEQIRYHKVAMRRHGFWHRVLTGSVVFFFLATIAFACLHSLHTAEDAAVFFSIALPAAGASLGVLLTVNQHQAMRERSARMRSDLAVVQRDVLDAAPDSLDKVTSEAARVIAQEAGGWFGSMWFLDIEHP